MAILGENFPNFHHQTGRIQTNDKDRRTLPLNRSRLETIAKQYHRAQGMLIDNRTGAWVRCDHRTTEDCIDVGDAYISVGISNRI